MKRFWRVLAIVLWTCVAFFGWLGAVYVGVLWLRQAQIRNNGKPMLKGMPQWLVNLMMIVVLFVGPLTTTALALVLGMKGRLPGTAKQRPVARGFEVAPPGN
jgi:hypothetical protein